MKTTERGELADYPVKVHTGIHRILVVEDDQLVRDLVVEILVGFGHEVIPANGGPSALHLLENDPAFDVMLSDVQMPEGMSGFQLAREVRLLLPDIAIILSSGMSGLLGNAEARALNLLILPKPYRIEDLSRVIDAAIKSIRRPPQTRA